MEKSEFSPRHATLEVVLKALNYFAVILTPIAGAIGTANVEFLAKAPKPLDQWLGWVNEQTAVVVLTLSIVLGLVQYGRRRLLDRWVWSLAQKVLDRLADDRFGKLVGDGRHQHRATLFQFRQWKFWIWPPRDALWYWPWGKGRGPRSGWLQPVLRSGHTSQKSRTVFLAPDNGTAEGVAGRIWSERNSRTLCTEQVPKGTEDAANIVAYATQTLVSTQWVDAQLREERRLPCWFLGVPVEVAGRVWGVLLLDSVESNHHPDVPNKGRVSAEVHRDSALAQAAYFLGKLLEGR
jgi:hypothetical protein